MSARSVRWAVAGVILGITLAACVTSAKVAGGAPAPQPPPAPPASPAPPLAGTNASGALLSFASSGTEAFDAWRDQFAVRAATQGRREATIRVVLEGLVPIDASVQAQSFDNQAEFVKPIWDYARSAVSATRIANGQAKLATLAATFDQIEVSYAPPREIVAAIWGMESSFGGYIGTEDAPRVLASQAAVGRRTDFNEAELLAIMQLIDDGSATREDFRKASWAGALGQTQFMPSSMLAYGRDFDRDGKKDLWANSGDALASAANYLSAFGWRKGQPWAVEAAIPEGFDYSVGDGRKQSVATWKELGLAPATSSEFASSDALQAELFLPAGSYGPAFLLFENFGVIKRYNNADSYALAIGMLADRLAGRPDLSRPWPTDMVMMTQDQAKDLQTGLNKLGYEAGAVDGIIGRGTRRALQRFQKDRALVADGFPTIDMLAKVLEASATP